MNFKSPIFSYKLAGIALAVALTASLSGCGGGSEQVQLAAVSVPLTVSSGASVTVVPGSSLVYSINGGGGGKTYTTYTAGSSNTSSVSASVNGSKLTITGVIGGSSNVTITDSAGATTVVAVTVGQNGMPSTFAISAPSAVTLDVGEVPQYLITGGSAPYQAVSSVAGVVSASVAGNSLTLTGVKVGTAIVNVRDVNGNIVSTAVTITPSTSVTNRPLQTIAPSAISVNIGVSPVYKIVGGVAPYSAISSSDAVATSVVSGGNLTIAGMAAGTANVSVFDSFGTVNVLTVTVSSSAGGKVVKLYSAAPSNVTIGLAESPSYTVAGGVSPYSVVSSSAGVAKASISTASGVSSISVTGVAAGISSLSIHDAAGDEIIIAVSVVNNASLVPLYSIIPPDVNFGFGQSVSYGVGGGAKPYTVVSGSPGIVTSSIAGDILTVTGVATGQSTIFIRDAAGVLITSTINVGPTPSTFSPLFSSLPGSVSIVKSSTINYTVSGGLAPYTVSSASPGVSTAVITGGNLTITAVEIGSAAIVIRDSAGSTLGTAVTVSAATRDALFTTAPSAISISVGATPMYGIGGGLAPYTAVSSNVSKATVSTTGSNFTVTGVATGLSEIVITDATGKTVTITATVN